MIAKQLARPKIIDAILTNESLKNDRKKEIAALDYQKTISRINFYAQLRSFKNSILNWRSKFQLNSRVEGKVNFVGFLHENQEVDAGTKIFVIHPENTNYFT